MLDTNTDLEWLTLRSSLRISPAQIVAESGPGDQYAGWGLANTGQYQNLIGEFFSGQNICCSYPINPATTAGFISLFGPTELGSNGETFLNGLVEEGPGGSVLTGSTLKVFFSYSPVLDLAQYDTDFGTDTAVYAFTGTFLVRSAPEPASLALLGSGLVAITLARRRRRRSE